MIHAADILAKVFSTSRYREGYDIDEVDSFLDALAANYRILDGVPEHGDHAMALDLTPQLIVDQRFKTARFAESYDMSDVDEFLDAIVADLHERNRSTGVVDEVMASLSAPPRGAHRTPQRFPAGLPSIEVINALQFARIAVAGVNKDRLAVMLPDGSRAGIGEVRNEGDGLVLVLNSPRPGLAPANGEGEAVSVEVEQPDSADVSAEGQPE